jgi:hypothetical protein
MFSIFKYITETISSINMYIYSCVTQFFTPSVLHKANETLTAIKKSTAADKATETEECINENKNDQIIEGFYEIHQDLLKMQPKLEYLATYVDAICVRQGTPAPGAKKKLREYLMELLNKHDSVGAKFDHISTLLENSQTVVETSNIITPHVETISQVVTTLTNL